MLQAFHKLNPKPKTIPQLNSALQQIWDDLLQTSANVRMHALWLVMDILNIRYRLI